MDLYVDEAIKIAHQAVFTSFSRSLTDVEIIVLKAAWQREEYDQIAARHGYATSYISQDVAPKLWKVLTGAFGIKVKKSNFKDVLQHYFLKSQNSPQDLKDVYFSSGQCQLTLSKPKSNSKYKEIEIFSDFIPAKPDFLIDQFYVERYPIESLCYETLLQPASLVRIKAPKLMGKTSLMERVLTKIRKKGFRTVSISCKMADRHTHLTNLNKFLRWFCLNLSRELSLPSKLDEYWDEGGIGAKVSCTAYLEEYLLPAADSPLVVYLDDVDALFPHPEVYEDLFELLRSWYEKARSRENWRKLRLAIAHTSEVYIRLNINQSPFNVGLVIELPELTREQVQTLAKKYGLTDNSTLVDSLIQLVGGHPYLLQQAFSHIKSYPDVTLEQFLSEAITYAGIYRYHLQDYWLSLQQKPKLLAAFQKVITSPRPVRLETISAYQLQSMGLVKLLGNKVEPRCQLYRSYFKEVMSIELNAN
ncbi:MAG TPA: AAA-like domain-containing protein [Nostocaceae cyanobacterium]|nr:AAA-like domain-containing protein [Nostocaceae cyanobacterium]